MRIFRYEHNRDMCTDPHYATGGDSPTGHGTFQKCGGYKSSPPNFGMYGCPPDKPMMPHERCAVTAEQFSEWIGPDYDCRFTSESCEGERYCENCPFERFLPAKRIAEWPLMAYEVNDSSEGIDWRIDAEQVVFNPAFATFIGEVSVSDVEKMTGKILCYSVDS
jgi:hypothetical protein